MIDVHNFRFQLNDGGVSTSTTGSRSSAPSCRRPMTREYESLFFRPALLLPLRFLLVTRRTLSPIATPFLVVLLFFAFAFCTFPTDHYFLFVTLYDELVQVRCSRREAFTGSPFFVPPPLWEGALLPFAFPPPSLSLSLALCGCSFFPPLPSALFPVHPAARSATFSRLGCPSAR